MPKEPITYRLMQQDLKAFNDNMPEAVLNIIHKFDWPEAITMSWMKMLNITFFTTPAAHRDLLVSQSDAFERDPRSGRLFRFIMGDSVFTTEGETWKRRRRLVQPSFHAVRINAYAETMAQYAAEMVIEWHDQVSVDVERTMTDLTMRIIARTMFGVDLKSMVDDIGQSMQTVLRISEQRLKEIIPRPDWWPSPAYRRQRVALANLKRILAEIIAQRRQTGEDYGDLLSMLLLSRNEDGDLLTDDEALAEAITLFVAGHETTTVTLMWAFKLLAEHPQVAAKLHAELDQVLAGRVPTLFDLPNLPYTEMVAKETLRLYPAAYNFGRISTEAVTVDGYALPKKRMVMLFALYFAASSRVVRRCRCIPDPNVSPRKLATTSHAMPLFPSERGRVCAWAAALLCWKSACCLQRSPGRVALSLPTGAQIKMVPQVTLHPSVVGQTGLPMNVKTSVRSTHFNLMAAYG